MFTGPLINQVFIDNFNANSSEKHIHLHEIQVWVNGENVAYYANPGIHGEYIMRGNPYDASYWSGRDTTNNYDDVDNDGVIGRHPGRVNDNDVSEINWVGPHSGSDNESFLGVRLSEPININDIQAIVIYNRNVNNRTRKARLNLALDYSYYRHEKNRVGNGAHVKAFPTNDNVTLGSQNYYLIKGPSFDTLPDSMITSGSSATQVRVNTSNTTEFDLSIEDVSPVTLPSWSVGGDSSYEVYFKFGNTLVDATVFSMSSGSNIIALTRDGISNNLKFQVNNSDDPTIIDDTTIIEDVIVNNEWLHVVVVVTKTSER